ncbi:MAG: kinesin, partial [Shinella sp.]|nr:kinesin [Shinella sp.]
MATNKSNETIDEKAFQALEEALKIDFDDLTPETPSKKDTSEARVSEPASRVSAKTQEKPATRPATSDTPRALTPEPAPKTPAFTPANDGSRKSPAAILKSLDVRSSRSSIRTAVLASILWVVGGLGVANLLYAPKIWEIRSVADLVALPGAIGMVVAIVMPIMLFFAFAIMISRAHELRSAARSMAEVALRLSEPETVATDRIMTVGQAVRREVSAMNEGIERTIARATELETLVHSEVNALERSYTDNEMRVRTLVQELGSEREAIVSHAERIRSSISGAHEQLKDELASAGDNITQRLATSGEAFASMLDTRAAMLMEKSDSATQTIGAMLSARTDSLLSTLSSSGLALANEFDARLDHLTKNLDSRGRDLLQQFETRASSLDTNTEKLNAALNERAKQLNETLIARTREISESLSVGQHAVTNGLDQVLQSMNAALDEKGAQFRQSLKNAADDPEDRGEHGGAD